MTGRNRGRTAKDRAPGTAGGARVGLVASRKPGLKFEGGIRVHDVLNPAEMFADELAQRRESGYDVADLEDDVRRAVDSGSPDEIDAACTRPRTHHAREPTGPTTSRRRSTRSSAACPRQPRLPPLPLDHDGLRDRLLGAWLGRCAGCNLGKPVEGWSRERIRSLPRSGRCVSDRRLPPGDRPATGGAEAELVLAGDDSGQRGVHGSRRRLDYTILGLHILEEHGFGSARWMWPRSGSTTFPSRRYIPRSGPLIAIWWRVPASRDRQHRNPYREWIGAPIRADMWGYVNPGDPRRAAASPSRTPRYRTPRTASTGRCGPRR